MRLVTTACILCPGDANGFSSHARTLRKCSTNLFPPALLLLLLLLLLLSVDQLATTSSTFRQKQFAVAQRTETTVDKRSLESFIRARSPDRFPHYTLTAESVQSDFVGSYTQKNRPPCEFSVSNQSRLFLIRVKIWSQADQDRHHNLTAINGSSSNSFHFLSLVFFFFSNIDDLRVQSFKKNL